MELSKSAMARKGQIWDMRIHRWMIYLVIGWMQGLRKKEVIKWFPVTYPDRVPRLLIAVWACWRSWHPLGVSHMQQKQSVDCFMNMAEYPSGLPCLTRPALLLNQQLSEICTHGRRWPVTCWNFLPWILDSARLASMLGSNASIVCSLWIPNTRFLVWAAGHYKHSE
jgi:hypothetical protein